MSHLENHAALKSRCWNGKSRLDAAQRYWGHEKVFAASEWSQT